LTKQFEPMPSVCPVPKREASQGSLLNRSTLTLSQEIGAGNKTRQIEVNSKKRTNISCYGILPNHFT
jgi:hypothetical protein